MDLRRERDLEQLRRIALVQKVQIDHLLRLLERKCAQVDSLTGKEGDLQQTLAVLEQMHARAVKELSDAESEPARTDAEPATEPSEDEPRVQRGHGPREQPALVHVPEVFELDEADRVCTSCGGRLEPLDGEFETSEMVDVVEVQYRVVQVQRQKYVCRCGGCVETAVGPDRAIDGGRFSLAFAAKVAVDKYVDHLPLARQARILERHGLEVSSQTLWDQLAALALGTKTQLGLERCHRALLDEAFSTHVIGLDQTGWPNLEKGASKCWQMWCVTSERVVYHEICDDKGAETFKRLLKDYRGVVVCDALSTHGAGARDDPDIELAGCWAHVHRYFEDAAKDHPEALVALAWIGELYALDARGNDLEQRAQLRGGEAKIVLEALHSWLVTQPTLATTSFGKAVRYTLAYWSRLTRFVSDARIPLDNNATERGLRGPVVGRKNHYGSKSRRGTEVAAILYSLVESAKVNRVEPARYLVEAVRAARRSEVLLPWQLAS